MTCPCAQSNIPCHHQSGLSGLGALTDLPLVGSYLTTRNLAIGAVVLVGLSALGVIGAKKADEKGLLGLLGL